MIDLDKLAALAKAAPGGQWEVWTSNSWRRVLANQCGRTVRVIEPTVQRHDSHPDLMFGEGVREYLEGVTPDAVLDLIAEVRALREDAERWRTEMALRNDPEVAIMYVGLENRCRIFKNGEAIASGSTYAEAIDAARGAK